MTGASRPPRLFLNAGKAARGGSVLLSLLRIEDNMGDRARHQLSALQLSKARRRRRLRRRTCVVGVPR